MNKKVLLTLGVVSLLAALVVGGSVYIKKQTAAKREKTIALAQKYADNGEYQRAIGILDGLLANNPDDIEAMDFISTFTDKQNAVDEAKEEQRVADSLAQQAENEKARAEQESRLMDSLLKSQNEKEANKLKENINDLLTDLKRAFSNDKLDIAETLRKDVLTLDPSNNEAKAYKDKIIERRKALENEKEREARLQKEKEIQALIDKAEKKIESKDTSLAEAFYNKVLNIDSKNLKALKGLADIAIDEAINNPSAIPEAINRIKKVLDEEPDNYPYLLSLANLYESRKDYRNELNTIKKILKVKKTPEYLVKAGIASFKLTEYKQAINYFKMAMAMDSTYPEIYYPMALSYEQLKDNKNRELALKYSMKYRADHATTYYELGRLYSENGNYRNSLGLFLKASSLNSESIKYRMGVALAYFNLEDYSHAIPIYEAIIRVDKTISEVYYNLSNAKSRIGEYESALESITMAIKLKPNTAMYIYTLGEIFEGLGQTDNAIKQYQVAIQINTKYYKAMLNLANIYDKQGRYPEGLELLETAKKINPKDPNVIFSLGISYLHNKNYDMAIPLLKESSAGDPESPIKLYNLSLAYTEIDEDDLAEAGFRQVLVMDSNFYDAYFYLGQLLFSLDRKDEARTLFVKVLELNPKYEKKAAIEEML